MAHTAGNDTLSQAPVHLKSISALNYHAALMMITRKKGKNRSRARAPELEHPRTHPAVAQHALHTHQKRKPTHDAETITSEGVIVVRVLTSPCCGGGGGPGGGGGGASPSSSWSLSSISMSISISSSSSSASGCAKDTAGYEGAERQEECEKKIKIGAHSVEFRRRRYFAFHCATLTHPRFFFFPEPTVTNGLREGKGNR